MQITITIPKLTTIRAHWRWGLLAVFMLAFTLTWSSPVGAPSVGAADENTKTQMDLAITGTFGGPVSCDSKIDTTCKLALGSSFTVSVVPKTIPPGGYAAWQSRIDYGSLLYKPASIGAENKWDLSFIAVRAPASPTGKEGLVSHGDASGVLPPFPASTQKTSLLNLTFNCDRNIGSGSFSQTISLIDFNASPSGAVYTQASTLATFTPNVSQITIFCNVPPIQMSLDAKNFDPGDSGLVSCTPVVKPTKCEATVGEQFDIIVDVNTIKAGSGYDIIFAEINLGGLIYKPGLGSGTDCDTTGFIKEIIWPDYVGGAFNCFIFDGSGGSGNVGLGAISKTGKSTFLGPIVKFNVACPATPGSHKVTLVPFPGLVTLGTYLENSTGDSWFPLEQVPGSEVDSLKINCLAEKREININPVQKDPGPPPFGCYNVLDDVKAFLFTVCDNNAQVGFPQTQPFPGLCDEDGTVVCEDSDPTKGKIRVSVVADNYNVVESKPPPNYDPTNTAQQPCDVKATAKCELIFFNEAKVLPWFPEDVNADGRVALGDFLRLLAAFGQVK